MEKSKFVQILEMFKEPLSKVADLLFMTNLQGNIIALTIVRILSLLCIIAFGGLFYYGLLMFNHGMGASNANDGGIALPIGILFMFISLFFMGIQMIIRFMSRLFFKKKDVQKIDV